MEFSEKLRRARLKAGMTQRELAKSAGVSLRSIINYEKAERRPQKGVIYFRLAKILGISPLYLMSDCTQTYARAAESMGLMSAGAESIKDMSNMKHIESNALQNTGKSGSEPVPITEDEHLFLINMLRSELVALDLTDAQLNDLLYDLIDEVRAIQLRSRLSAEGQSSQ